MVKSQKKQKHLSEEQFSKQQIIQIIEKQPENIKEELVEVLVAEQTHSMTYSGPIPHPDLLRQFDDVIPNGADRIMKMAEIQSAHRQQLEAKVVNANNRDSLFGVISATLICLTAIIGAIWLLSLGKSIEGLAVLITSLGSVVYVFIKGRKADYNDLKSKSQQIQNK